MSSEMCNDTFNKGLSHCFYKKQLTLGKEKMLKSDKKNCYWIMTSSNWSQVSSDLGEVNSFYISFSEVGQKSLLSFKSAKKLSSYRVKGYLISRNPSR